LSATWLSLAVVIGAHFARDARTELAWNSYYGLLPASDQEKCSPSEENLDEQRKKLAEVCSSGTTDPDHYYRLGLLELQIFTLRASRSPNCPNFAEARQILRTKHVNNPDGVAAWLTEVYGEERTLLELAQEHFRQALRCCPLTGSAYVRLAELAFLDGPAAP